MSALPVLYSFRRCPYAMRARLALAVSGQRCELREVVLKAKPQGLLQASPKGTVPVLVLPSGQVLEQSLDIMLWALGQHDPQRWLCTPARARRQRCRHRSPNAMARSNRPWTAPSTPRAIQNATRRMNAHKPPAGSVRWKPA